MQYRALHPLLAKNPIWFLLEVELNACLEPEVALVIVACRKVIAKSSQQIVKLSRPYGEVFAQRNIDAPADDKIKGIVAGRRAEVGAARAELVNISVEIAVRSTEQGLDKWLNMRGAEFYNGTNVVSEQVARSGNKPSGGSKIVRITPIALKFRFDSDELAEVKSTRTAATV